MIADLPRAVALCLWGSTVGAIAELQHCCFNKAVSFYLWLALEFFPGQSQEPSGLNTLGPACPASKTLSYSGLNTFTFPTCYPKGLI